MASKSLLERLDELPITRGGKISPTEKQLPFVARPSSASKISDVVAPVVAPLALGLGLGNVAARTLPQLTRLLGPASSTALGESAGGFGGEAINQATGITEESSNQLLLAGGAPVIARFALGTMARLLPPTSKGARFLNVAGFDQFKESLKTKLPRQAARALFKEFDEMADAPILLSGTLDTAIERSSELGKLSTRPSSLGPINRLVKKITATGDKKIPIKEVQRELELIQDLIESSRVRGGTGLGALKTVRGALLEDLKRAAEATGQSEEAAQLLLQARRNFLRESTVDDIMDEATKQFKVIGGSGEAQQFNAAPILNKLKTGDSKVKDFYEVAFDASERKEIEFILTNLNELPPLPPRMFLNIGGKRTLGSLSMAGAGGATAGITAEQLGAGASGEIGVGVGVGLLALGPIINSFKVIKMALTIPAGRRMLSQMLSASGGKLSPQAMAILAATIRAQFAEPGENIDVLNSLFPEQSGVQQQRGITIEPRSQP